MAELYTTNHERKAPSRPGSLPEESYAAITAYILSFNVFEAGETALPPDPDALANMQPDIPQESKRGG